VKGWHMYSRIQELKEQGFSIRKAAQITKINRGTITKYWDMSPEEFARTLTEVNKMSSLAAYEHIVVNWLESYPCMSAAQVQDWLMERYKIDTADRTIRRYVAGIREKYKLSRNSEPLREYEAVDEMPRGYQMQMDFGVKGVRDAYSSRYRKLYFVAFVLSCSRYKWGFFQDRPFTSADLVRALWGCFHYMGGMPRQLVYDQDTIIVVSENNGDIIHTQAFTGFLNETKISTLVCRKSDPETKGKIEAVVRFIKGNFMENRLFMNIDVWNSSFEEWLDRTGNMKKHETTKRKPEEMFFEEQPYLLPLYGNPPISDTASEERTVNKDNTILYNSNRYSVPLGTYSSEKTVQVECEENTLKIYTVTGDLLAEHTLSTERGKLVKSDSHRKQKEKKVQEKLDKAIKLLGEEFRAFLSSLVIKKPRYVREQLGIVVKTCQDYGREVAIQAVMFCQENDLISANDLHNAVLAFSDSDKQEVPSRLPVESEKYHIAVHKRPLSIYSDVAEGRW